MNTQVHDNFFQLAFQDGEIWDLQEEIFKAWEEGKMKGQCVKTPSSSQQGKGASGEDALKAVLEKR